ncbi:MAG: acyl-CoA thioesterase, partial [Gammaproteobacteria bacterium]
GIQRLTWVAVGQEGHVTVEAFPEFFARFISERLSSPSGPFMPPLGRLSESPDHQAPVWRRGPACIAEYGTARTLLETDETHSNFVGNIYFSHAAVLAERSCLKVLRGLGACSGGFFATTLQLDHLGEAMPGDTLEAEARLVEVGEHFCVFELSLVNRSRGDVKIATGRARYRLFESVPNNEVEEDFQSQPMPEWLRSAFAAETP